MSGATLKGHRAMSAAVLGLGGIVVAAATWTGGDHAWAIAALAIYVALALAVYGWAGRSGDVAAILRLGADERQRGLDHDATAISGLAMTAVALLGAVIELGRTGNPGVYGLFCAVSAIAYTVGLLVLRSRR